MNQKETLLRTEELVEGKYYAGAAAYPEVCGIIIKVLKEMCGGQSKHDFEFIEIETVCGAPEVENRAVWYKVDLDRWVEITEEESIVHKLAQREYYHDL